MLLLNFSSRLNCFILNFSHKKNIINYEEDILDVFREPAPRLLLSNKKLYSTLDVHGRSVVKVQAKTFFQAANIRLAAATEISQFSSVQFSSVGVGDSG